MSQSSSRISRGARLVVLGVRAAPAPVDRAPGMSSQSLLSSGDIAIDLVITDVVMPRATGRDVLRWLRTNRPSIGVLLISGYPQRVGEDDGGDETGAPILAKSFPSRTPLSRVREILDSRNDAPGSSAVELARHKA